MAVGVSEYSRALARLFERVGNRVAPGLETTEKLLAALGDPHRAYPSLHIAGTNGKGSTVATLDALLRPGGRRVGRYTSPHLIDFRERVAVNGVAISEDEVVALLARIEPLAIELERDLLRDHDRVGVRALRRGEGRRRCDRDRARRQARQHERARPARRGGDEHRPRPHRIPRRHPRGNRRRERRDLQVRTARRSSASSAPTSLGGSRTARRSEAPLRSRWCGPTGAAGPSHSLAG